MLPGCSVEADEAIEVAARRELFEELAVVSSLTRIATLSLADHDGVLFLTQTDSCVSRLAARRRPAHRWTTTIVPVEPLRLVWHARCVWWGRDVGWVAGLDLAIGGVGW
ncbi:MAG: NUDIX domain-containing protein [Propionibacteriaceae bacterium]|jgi:ADP-ribose pyrophosphatase YjhB (NUDIX family)|nr:NUDIX domain-containing protein [Propionibacteriaceae bacterium]